MSRRRMAFVRGWTENGDLVNLPFAGGVQVTASADRNLVANFAYPAYQVFITAEWLRRRPAAASSSAIPPAFSGSYYGGNPHRACTAAGVRLSLCELETRRGPRRSPERRTS